jgi:hypothetical protein
MAWARYRISANQWLATQSEHRDLRSTISKRVTPKRCSGWRLAKMAGLRLLVAAQLAKTRLIGRPHTSQASADTE